MNRAECRKLDGMKLRPALAISLVVAVVAIAAYFLIVRAPSAAARELGRQIRAEFAKTFQFEPEIRTESRTLLGQTKAVLELATAKKEIRERYRMEHEWLGSVKVFEIEGRFAARAGFDLVEPISIRIDEAAKQIRVIAPSAKLLGLEMAGIRVIADEDGWWNKLTAQDREKALTRMQANARAKIGQTDLLAEADTHFQTLASEMLRSIAPGYSVSFNAPIEPKK